LCPSTDEEEPGSMVDLKRELSILVNIARVDAALHGGEQKLRKLPDELSGLEKKIAALEGEEAAANARLNALVKEKREVDTALADFAAQITKLKNQLMAVKTNREYTAMNKEIETIESQVDAKESRLLELMDEIAEQEARAKEIATEFSEKRNELVTQKTTLESEIKAAKVEVEQQRVRKPKLIAEIDVSIRKKYERLLERWGDMGATRIEGECCGGCGTQLPPQLAVEVRNNDKLIMCQHCGRILIYYAE